MWSGMGPKGDTSAIGLKHPREIKKNSRRAFRLCKIHIHCAPLNRSERRHDTSASGRLRGMLEVPGTDWGDKAPSPSAALRNAPIPAEWRWSDGTVRHVFTHFALELRVACAVVKGRPLKDAEWVPVTQFGTVALPSVMQKVAKLALASAAQKRAAQ